MARAYSKPQPAHAPAADLDAAIARIAEMNVDELRVLWRATHGSDPPAAFSKDLVARALIYRLQERALGGLAPQTLRLLRSVTRADIELPRHIKVGSIIVREFNGTAHEVLVVPGGFCWQGKSWSSLSTIAREITGTNWNGPRFFGLRSKESAPADSQDGQGATGEGTGASSKRAGRRSSVRTKATNDLAHRNAPSDGKCPKQEASL